MSDQHLFGPLFVRTARPRVQPPAPAQPARPMPSAPPPGSAATRRDSRPSQPSLPNELLHSALLLGLAFVIPVLLVVLLFVFGNP